MKKIIIISLILTFLISFEGYAETWSCSYVYKGEVNNTIRIRKGDSFKTGWDSLHKIIYEDNNFIHLYDSFLSFTDYFATVLNKQNKSFSMVAINGKNDTDIISGKCLIHE